MKHIPLITALASFILSSPIRADNTQRTVLAEELISVMRMEAQSKASKDVWQKLKPEFSRAYAEVFTEEELRGIVAFYKSPIGQALLTKGGEVGKRVIHAQSKTLQQMVQQGQAENRESECLRRIGSLGNAITLYAGDHGSTLPKTIAEAIGDYLPDNPTTREEMVSPFAPDTTTPSYEFVTPGAKLSGLRPDAILIRCKFKSPGGRRSVYRANGKTEMIDDK